MGGDERQAVLRHRVIIFVPVYVDVPKALATLNTTYAAASTSGSTDFLERLGAT
jgi:hypothetical protein